jgi:hypothetical protein
MGRMADLDLLSKSESPKVKSAGTPPPEYCDALFEEARH